MARASHPSEPQHRDREEGRSSLVLLQNARARESTTPKGPRPLSLSLSLSSVFFWSAAPKRRSFFANRSFAGAFVQHLPAIRCFNVSMPLAAACDDEDACDDDSSQLRLSADLKAVLSRESRRFAFYVVRKKLIRNEKLLRWWVRGVFVSRLFRQKGEEERVCDCTQVELVTQRGVCALRLPVTRVEPERCSASASGGFVRVRLGYARVQQHSTPLLQEDSPLEGVVLAQTRPFRTLEVSQLRAVRCRSCSAPLTRPELEHRPRRCHTAPESLLFEEFPKVLPLFFL